MIRMFFSLIIIGMSLSLSAQWRGLRLTTIGPEEGLGSEVLDVLRDSAGYMYFGGVAGLIRHDGKNFMTMQPDASKSGEIFKNEYYKMIFGRDGLIWMTVNAPHISAFNPKTLAFIQYRLPPNSQHKNIGTTWILEDENNDLWVGGNKFLLYHFDKTTKQFETYQPEWLDTLELQNKAFDIRKIVQDVRDPDLLWISVSSHLDPDPRSHHRGYGLVSFNKKTKKFKSFPNVGIIISRGREE